jgi:hypothetical protein
VGSVEVGQANRNDARSAQCPQTRGEEGGPPRGLQGSCARTRPQAEQSHPARQKQKAAKAVVSFLMIDNFNCDTKRQDATGRQAKHLLEGAAQVR